MTNQRHKRKEYFTILFISNTNRCNKQFQISLFFLKLLLIILPIFCVGVGTLIYLAASAQGKQNTLHTQLAKQKQLTQQLQTENDSLKKSIEEKTKEAESLANMADEQGSRTKPKKDATYPSLYPSKGPSVLQASYTPEQTFMSIATYTGCYIVATGDGTVVSVRSDDTYKHIIDIQHESGYTTRYLCRQDAELKIAEGTQVQAGTVLLAITSDDVIFDYQVIYENNAVDPLTVIDAVG